ncbi:Leucine-rich repeat and Leucine-rich repeat, typical subtype-containing protein [Strongyloides ratti]|uniref:Leucine-rich repeat and Leucine-rich repeat, typical subtype-containing protein n=1 Tax=Strongyloides ratti TaxID=34506 RepID=A0A090KY13_STRRB|nr:Leucine-rich repeat and Leucine-rich repeat, typical subtype-containing protein [Strongyloides ratti]CEF60732.1 Leucine-rich repeat and Leucine-rich repeat, typical subtype-containing protein [Strongyloides ratti]
MLLKSILVILSFTAIVSFINATCPEFMKNQTACTCVDYMDGPVIKCYGPTGPTIVDKLKKKPMEIRELVIEKANIIEIGGRAFKNLKIKKLVLDNNKIKFIHQDAFKGLENVLIDLSINMNKLPEIPTKALEHLKILSILSLRCNMISDINGIAFKSKMNLIDLNLSCNQICDIHKDAFINIKHSIQNLVFDQNCLKKIPSESIKNMDNLIGLHFKYNNIKKIESGDLKNLPSLNIITGTGNKIETIEKDVVEKNNTIKYIYFSDNAITKLEDCNLENFKEVEVVDLSFNKISEVPTNIFSKLERLQHLNLEANAIRDISNGAFDGIPLLLLWLPHNCLSMISASMFKGALFLRQVSLAHNNIHVVQPLSFAHLANLHTLDLSFNKIKNLQPGAIDGSDYLTVRLQENPMVCSQDGFHVMNGHDAINLTTEPNNICKAEHNNDFIDICPKKISPPGPQACCIKKTNKPTTTTTPEPKKSKIILSTIKPKVKLLDMHPQQITLDSAGTNMHIKRRKFNMERFWRLSKRPTEPLTGVVKNIETTPEPKSIDEDKQSLVPGEHNEFVTVPISDGKRKSEDSNFNVDAQVSTVEKDVHVALTA